LRLLSLLLGFTMKSNLLVVDDEESIRLYIQSVFKGQYNVFTAFGNSSCFEILAKCNIDIVLLDIKLGYDNGIDLLKEIKKKYNLTEVVMLTVIKDLRTAVKAMQFGAYDYITKDLDVDDLRQLIKRAHQKQKLNSEVFSLRNQISELTEVNTFKSLNPRMQQIESVVQRISTKQSSVLIQGESGTGKEVVAKQIHRLSLTMNKISYAPFVTVNISSIPAELIESTLFGHEKGAFTSAHRMHRGKFELAHGGTLFLDEIGELKLDLQVKLLRAIQEREIERVGGEQIMPVSVRIIAATNQKLQDLVSQGKFREDLYYRLNVIPIFIPPIRERMEDLSNFIDLFFSKYTSELNKNVKTIDDTVKECLCTYSWPGNVREIENVLERMVVLCESDRLGLNDVPLEIKLNYKFAKNDNPDDYELVLRNAVDDFERGFILSSLSRNRWHQQKTAKDLGIHRKTLEYKIKRYNFEAIMNEKRKNRITGLKK